MYPLKFPQSYGLTLLEKDKKPVYINEILTIKNKNFDLMEYKNNQKSQTAEKIRKNENI